jgi:cytochrome P450
VSHDFGIPHPVTAQNYGLELLNLPAMPPFSGGASRFLAESLDSPNLYWARLADEQGDAPVLLNHLAPELTRAMIEKIFATDFEDWPALLRAMHETGEDFRQGKVGSIARMTASRP